jgi:hypothetical protein
MRAFGGATGNRLAQTSTLFLLTFATFGCSTGGGTTASLTVPPPPSNSLSFAPIATISSGGTRPGSVALADFNGDGKMDIAVSNFTSNTISVFLNKGDGTFQAPIVSPVQIIALGLGPIAVGDFNQDGKPDLVVGTIAGLQADIVLLGNGDGTFHQLAPIPNSFGFFHARVGDLNGDGHLDLVTGDNGNISVFLGHGDGTFSAGTFLPTASFPSSYLGIVVGDFNGDNKLDIVACDTFSGPFGTLVFYAGKGDGTFQSPTAVPLISSFPGSLASGDFNGDSKRDLLIGFPGEAFVALGNGDGTFQLRLSSLIPVSGSNSFLTSNALYVQAADLNQDGKLDALVADYDGGTLTLVLNGALGKLPPDAGIYQFTLKPGLSDIAVGDLNNDGLPDIVVSNALTNEISIALSQKP